MGVCFSLVWLPPRTVSFIKVGGIDGYFGKAVSVRYDVDLSLELHDYDMNNSALNSMKCTSESQPM